MPIRYVFEFTNNNIHLDIFSVGDDSTLLNQVDFKTDGVIEPVTNISVVLNGNTLEFDQPPVILNDRVLVPLRKIFEELGATVDYQSSIDNTPGHNNAELKFISAKTDSTELKLNLTWQGDWQYITYENGAPKESGYLTEEAGYVPPVILNDRTLVPVRFVSETLGASVDWNGDTKTVIINTNLSAERNDS